MEKKTIDYAIKWFDMNDVTICKSGTTGISVLTDDFELELSNREIEYRAELYLDEIQSIKNK